MTHVRSALTKSEIAARAVTLGRPISVALAGTVLSTTGGCPRTVDVALDAAQRTDADTPATKVVTDAVYAHHLEMLSAMDDIDRTVVVLAHYGVGSDVEVVHDLLDVVSDAGAVLGDAVESGLLTPSGAAVPDVGRALEESLGRRRLAGILIRLLEYRVKTDTLDAPTAVMLTQSGIRHPELARFLTSAADAATPSSAAHLYELAVTAGADALLLAARRGETAALLGDLASAERFCDSVLEQYESVDTLQLRIAVRTSAMVAAERGMMARSASLYTWLGSARAGADADLAVAVALTAGDRTAADALTTAVGAAPPTASGAATALLADGLRQSIDARSTHDTTAATNTLLKAVSLSDSTTRRVAPDSAAAAAILFALHCGDPPRAEATALHALAALPSNHPDTARIALLHAWATMLSGDLLAAQARVDALQIPRSHSRNQFFFHGLRVGLARRSGDAGSLHKAWDDAQDVIARFSVDLLSFLPVGELWLAAVRVNQQSRISHLIAGADTVITGLNQPHAWASALHWYGVQAAILAEQPADLVPHARALAVAAETNQYSAALAAAGRAWLAVLQGHPDVTDVNDAAHSLTRFGLSWDGARLASEAALRVEDTRSATTLLQVARSLRQPIAAPASIAEEPKGSLSAREAEVAELLVLGVTYKEAGARLYISAKTVEHHVARIRRRLGAGSRSELLSMLRALGYGANPTE